MARIWVIEDDSIVAQTVAELLKVMGHNVTCHQSGLSAINDLQDVSNHPDLAILDLKMPPPDGNDVLGVVMSLGRPPVIVLTGYPNDIRAEVKGVPVAVLSKPFHMEELKRAVSDALAPR